MPSSDPGQLALTLSSLFTASRTDGRQRAHTLGHGLQLTVGTADGDFVALSRKAGEPDMLEAAVVAEKAGWISYSTDWQDIAGSRYLVIRPDSPTEDPPDEGDTDPPSPEIVALLTDPQAPWRHRTFTAQAHEARDDAVRRMSRAELHEEMAWLRTKWGPQLRAWQQGRLREVLAGPAP
ncbi:hypothetical protein [Deinococcus marmoris]|uniref:Uncharacterized protein n=1 Tax=Deinococcus marmoris TaxID=249408 RepID=A0A1U7P4V1_9DEIO|nr:hypothetical protein [Deinococcus marmoris]OLV20189.1 hypothetical protein BOO71_0000595 [Deinococcus marmoris]